MLRAAPHRLPALGVVLGLTLLGCPRKEEKSRPEPSPAATTPAPPPSVATTAKPSRYKAREVADGRSITVRVDFTGSRKPARWELAGHFKGHCGTTAASDGSLAVADGGGVDGAVVWLDDITEGAAAAPAIIAQDEKGCVFAPHVLAAAPSSTLHLTNSDPSVHQVRLDFGPGTNPITKTIAPNDSADVAVRPEWAGRVARVTCPIHAWMWSYAHFFDHPYFAITKAGSASLANVPPGTYHLVVWHEGVGATYANALTLPPDETARVEVTIGKDDVKLAFAMGDDGKIARRP